MNSLLNSANLIWLGSNNIYNIDGHPYDLPCFISQGAVSVARGKKQLFLCSAVKVGITQNRVLNECLS